MHILMASLYCNLRACIYVRFWNTYFFTTKIIYLRSMALLGGSGGGPRTSKWGPLLDMGLQQRRWVSPGRRYTQAYAQVEATQLPGLPGQDSEGLDRWWGEQRWRYLRPGHCCVRRQHHGYGPKGIPHRFEGVGGPGVSQSPWLDGPNEISFPSDIGAAPLRVPFIDAFPMPGRSQIRCWACRACQLARLRFLHGFQEETQSTTRLECCITDAWRPFEWRQFSGLFA